MSSTPLADVIRQCRAAGNYDRLVEAIPYARFIGMRCEVEADGSLLFRLPAKQENIGNPTLPALHGGAIGGFMEHSALVYLLATMDQPRMPKTIDLSIDYLRAGHYRDCWASCTVTRQGRRVANVTISCWQDDRAAPITHARAHFLLADPDAAAVDVATPRTD
ncbi:MAG: PaaI family thioesterase [Gammaproteobacteria bacterium]